MTIDELIAAIGLTANDEIPVWDAEATGEPTKKITAQQLASAVVALANLVTGVKGNSEQNYRNGNVNLTPANIGAHPARANLQVTNNTDYAGNTTVSQPVAQILDTSNFIRHQLYGMYNSNGSFYTILAARKPNGSSALANQMSIGFDANGDGAYYISHPAAFRDAIGATNTKVKGAAESSYRSGDVNLTPANIGAFGAGSIGAITDANNTSLYGSRLFQANACANLPTNGSDEYYQVEFFGVCQMAFRHFSTGLEQIWVRHYINTKWYPWVRIDKVTGIKGDAESTYRTGNVNLTPENIGAAQCILFESRDTTPALIYAKLDNLALNNPAVCRMYDATITAISGGKITNGSFGTVLRSGTNTFYFFVSKANGDKLFSFGSTITASSITVGNAYQYSGTAL